LLLFVIFFQAQGVEGAYIHAGTAGGTAFGGMALHIIIIDVKHAGGTVWYTGPASGAFIFVNLDSHIMM
jgi:hypothetical protein